MSALDPNAPPAKTTPPRVPFPRRLAQALLYDKNIDRTRKTKARIGLAVLCFAFVYFVIAARLVLFAVAPDSHVARRAGSSDAVATARPEILDRNGEVLATDVRVPSLFAEPRRIIDVDEAVELLTAVMPDLDTSELRERLGSKRGFAWLKREIKPKQQQEVHRLGIPGVGFLNENKRVYP
jgi:cell division protein FtsI (penicillin-binding protein 3)